MTSADRVVFRYPLSQAICSIADRAVRVCRIVVWLAPFSFRTTVSRRWIVSPGNLGDPLLADVREDVQGQVPGVCLLAVRPGYCCCFSGNGVAGSSSAAWNRYAVARLR